MDVRADYCDTYASIVVTSDVVTNVSIEDTNVTNNIGVLVSLVSLLTRFT
jgi:hypothetical protein